ncbi:MAG TPA: FAD:protein FMN transferase, partial [Chitinophagaceae bacterium]
MKQVVYFLAITICLSSRSVQSYKKWELTGYAQGTTYHIKYYATDSIFTQSQVDSILNSLDSSLSLYKPYSVVNAFNNSLTGIIVDTHLRNVVRKGMEVYDSTEGTFDITVWPLVTAWGFGVKKITEVPDSAAIARLLPCIGTDKLQLSGNLLKKKLPCVQL